MYALSEGWQLANKSKTNPFLSVMFAINLITWPSLIPNFVVHRKPRWWPSNSLIRLWFLYWPLFNSLSQLKDIRIYDFTFGLKKNKFENWRSWDCKENSWNSFTWAVLLTETHRFYKRQPVQGRCAICGPCTRKFSSWKNAVIQQHTLVIFSQTNEILENRDAEPFSLIIYFC